MNHEEKQTTRPKVSKIKLLFGGVGAVMLFYAGHFLSTYFSQWYWGGLVILAVFGASFGLMYWVVPAKNNKEDHTGRYSKASGKTYRTQAEALREMIAQQDAHKDTR